jgi:hypothetical protein
MTYQDKLSLRDTANTINSKHLISQIPIYHHSFDVLKERNIGMNKKVIHLEKV